MRRIAQYLCGLSSLVLLACGVDSSGGGGAAAPRGDFDTGGDTGARPDTGGQPPENEAPFLLQAPRASRSFVFVANTSLNSLAKIDTLTLQVVPIEVCLEPTEVRTLPTLDRAVVLCEGDDRVAVVEASDGTDDVVRESWVAENANSLLLAPNGDYALAWFDVNRAAGSDDPGNPQDLTLIALGDGEAAPQSYLLSVGFQIRAISFDASGQTAFVTTDDGLNVIDMAAVDRDQFAPLLSIGEDPLARATDREVHVTDDGALAFVRTDTFSGLRVLDIATGELTDIELPASPTDLDLFPGGQRGIAVMRALATVAVMPLPDAVDSPELIELVELPGRTIGLAQLTPDGDAALLYSTVLGATEMTVLEFPGLTHSTHLLAKPVAGVVMAPASNRALVLHHRDEGLPVAGEPLDDFIAKSFGYSLFDVGTGFARLVLVETQPDDLAFSESGDQAFVVLEDAPTDVRLVDWVDFESFRVRSLQMARPPESVGVVPATGRVFVSQLAATGRITFIDTETGRQQHVTAFQLNRRIE